MFVWSLCRQFCPEKLPVQPEQRLGDGADGEVLSIVGDSEKVLKLGILYERHDYGMLNYYKQIKRVLEYFITAQPHAYVHVYEQGYLGTYTRPMAAWRKGEQKFIIYYYIMEKLDKISDDESKVFHSILSHEDRGIDKNFSSEKIKKMLEGMASGLDFDAEKVTLFCDNIRNTPISHLDIHPRNVMKDKMGNFKLIDLDRIELEKENAESTKG
jgi:serine/threonine protein kinase